MREAVRREPLALVLGGGGSKGALQVGLYRALVELDLVPDLVVGASVGAINGAFIAAGLGPRALAEGWSRLSRGDLFGFNWSVLRRGLGASSLFTGRRLREFLEDHLPVRRFDELSIPLHVVTTHLSLGAACRISDGDLIEALLASTSIPGLLPPVELHDGVSHVDGSLGDNLPIRAARELGAGPVIAFAARTCDRCEPGPHGLVGVIGRAFGIAADCSLRRLDDSLREDPEVLLLRPELAEHVYALDFSGSASLVDEGYCHARAALETWLADRPNSES